MSQRLVDLFSEWKTVSNNTLLIALYNESIIIYLYYISFYIYIVSINIIYYIYIIFIILHLFFRFFSQKSAAPPSFDNSRTTHSPNDLVTVTYHPSCQNFISFAQSFFNILVNVFSTFTQSRSLLFSLCTQHFIPYIHVTFNIYNLNSYVRITLWVIIYSLNSYLRTT